MKTPCLLQENQWNLKGLRFWHEVAEEHAWQRAKVQVGFGDEETNGEEKPWGGDRKKVGHGHQVISYEDFISRVVYSY